MTFANLSGGGGLFLDANVLLYHFTGHPQSGSACSDLLDRVERGEVEGYSSAPVLAEVAHRLMTIEASTLFSWPAQGIANRLRRHPAEVQRLSRYRQAIDEVSLIGIRILNSSGRLVSLAADVSHRTGLLSADALIVATLREHKLTNLASNDADFDRVPGITRYAPA